MYQTATVQGDVTATMGRQGMLDALKTEDAERNKIIDKIKQEVKEQGIMAEAIRKGFELQVKNGNAIESMKAQIILANDEIEHGNLTEEERRKKIDEQLERQRQLQDMMKGSKQVAQEHLALLEAHKSMQQATTAQIITQIDKMLQGKLTDEERVALEKKRYDLIQAEVDLEAQRDAKRREGLQKERDAINELQKLTSESNLDAIQNKYDRETAQEEDRHQKALAHIEEEASKYPDMELRQAAIDAENARNRTNLHEIELDRIRERFDLEQMALGESLAGDLAAINHKYDEAERRATKLFTDDKQRAEVLAGLKKQRDLDVTTAQIQHAEQVMGAAQNMLSGVATLAKAVFGDAAGEFVNGLQQALSVVQAIVQIVSAIQAIRVMSFLQSGGMVLAAQHGIIVPGAGDGDKIPIMAEPGEGILNKRAVRALGGPGAIYAMNRMVPRFGSGGTVNPLSLLVRDPEIMSYIMSGEAGKLPALPAFGGGGVSHDEFNVLIDEVRRLNDKMDQNTKETKDLADRINLKIPDKIELRAKGRDLRETLKRDDRTKQ